MNMRKAVRKVAALGTGALMMGATLMSGAFAADLSDFPKPLFIDPNTGAFNGILVVGEKAKVPDVQGASSVMATLQAAAVKKTTINVEGSRTTTNLAGGEGVLIQTGSNYLTLNESLRQVKTNLDDDDLPKLLAEGTYVADGDDASNTYDYEQKITFGSGKNATFTFYESSDYELDEDNPVEMLYQPESTNFYVYELSFKKAAESDLSASSAGCGDTNELCDLEDTKISMLGMEYDITQFEYVDDGGETVTANDTVTIEMMGGATIHTLYEGQTATYELEGNQYEVRADVVGTGSSSSLVTILSVNGEPTKELTKGQTDKVAGIEVGIKQLIENEAQEEGAGQDLVQFYLGAKKMTLSDTDPSSATMDADGQPAEAQEIQLESQDIDYLYGDIQMAKSGSKWALQKITIAHSPSDAIFITEDQSYSMPGLEAFDIQYAGMTKGTEETIQIKPHTDDRVQLTVPIDNGKTTFDVLYKPAGAYRGFNGTGQSASEPLVLSCTADMGNGAGVFAKKTKFVVSDSTQEETHIVEFDNFKSDTSTTAEITMEDSFGTKYTKTCTLSTDCAFTIGDNSLTLANFTIASKTIELKSTACGVSNKIYTAEGATVTLPTLGNAINFIGTYNTTTINITEEDNNDQLAAGNVLTATISGGAASCTNCQTSVTGVSGNSLILYPATSSGFYDLGDTEKMVAMSNFGTYVLHDQSGDNYDVEFTYPGEEARAQVYVNAPEAQITSGSSGTGGEVVTETIVDIPSTASKMDTEVSSPSAQNVITIGGPCVNSVTAAWLGVPYNEFPGCLEGAPAEGKAYIQLMEQGGNVGLIVSGRTAEDTRRATEVLSNFANSRWKDLLVGTEVEVSGTSTELDAITVSAPSE